MLRVLCNVMCSYLFRKGGRRAGLNGMERDAGGRLLRLSTVPYLHLASWMRVVVFIRLYTSDLMQRSEMAWSYGGRCLPACMRESCGLDINIVGSRS